MKKNNVFLNTREIEETNNFNKIKGQKRKGSYKKGKMRVLLVLVIFIFKAISFPTLAYVRFYKVRRKNEKNNIFLNRKEIEKNNNFNKINSQK